MTKITENTTREINGGADLHCTVCCYAGTKNVTYANNWLGKIAFAAHCATSAHKKNVKTYGYGHRCL